MLRFWGSAKNPYIDYQGRGPCGPPLDWRGGRFRVFSETTGEYPGTLVIQSFGGRWQPTEVRPTQPTWRQERSDEPILLRKGGNPGLPQNRRLGLRSTFFEGNSKRQSGSRRGRPRGDGRRLPGGKLTRRLRGRNTGAKRTASVNC